MYNKRLEHSLNFELLNINGNDLLTLGIPKGKEIGIVLEKLLFLVMDDPKLNTKEKLVEVIKKEFI